MPQKTVEIVESGGISVRPKTCRNRHQRPVELSRGGGIAIMMPPKTVEIVERGAISVPPKTVESSKQVGGCCMCDDDVLVVGVESYFK